MALVTRNLNNTASPLTNPDGTPLANATIIFTIVDGTTKDPVDVIDATTTEQVIGEVSAVTDSLGIFSIKIWPNSRGNISTLYRVSFHQRNIPEFYSSINDIPADLDWVTFKLGGNPLPIADIPVLADAASYAAESAASAAIALSAATINNIYIAASAAALRLIAPVSGYGSIIKSSDGGYFNAVTGAPAGTYTNNGGVYAGTNIIPTGGDGSSAWVRDYSMKSIHDSWFGVIGDGVTDDTAALTAVLEFWKNASSMLLIIDPRPIRITSPILIKFTENDISGKSIFAYGSTLVSALSSGWLLTIESASVVRNLTFSGMRFSGGTGTETGMFKLNGGNNGSSNFLYGLVLRDIDCDNTYNAGLALHNNIFESSLYNVQSRSVNLTGTQIEIKNVSGTGIPSSLSLYSCITSAGDYGIRIVSPASDVNLFGCTAIVAGLEGILHESMSGQLISGCHLENNHQLGGAGAGLKVIGHGKISGCFGTTILATNQKYVVEVVPTGLISIDGGLAQGATVKYLNVSGGVGSVEITGGVGSVDITGGWDYDTVSGVALSVHNGTRDISNISSSREQFIGYAASVTPVIDNGGSIRLGTLTGAITINAVTGTPMNGDVISFYFLQDTTGGRIISWDSVYKVNWTPDTTAGKLNTITFKFQNTTWNQIGYSTGL